jgi:DNA-binding NarL/FixJ family response regulator
MMNIITYILEDAEADRDFIEFVLKDDDRLDITYFYDPISFKENLSDDINIVITDVRIPHYDVFKTIEYIRDNFPGIYIIVMSGYFDDAIYERLFELGVDRVVKKGTDEKWVRRIAKYINDFLPKIELKQELMK